VGSKAKPGQGCGAHSGLRPRRRRTSQGPRVWPWRPHSCWVDQWRVARLARARRARVGPKALDGTWQAHALPRAAPRQPRSRTQAGPPCSGHATTAVRRAHARARAARHCGSGRGRGSAPPTTTTTPEATLGQAKPPSPLHPPWRGAKRLHASVCQRDEARGCLGLLLAVPSLRRRGPDVLGPHIHPLHKSTAVGVLVRPSCQHAAAHCMYSRARLEPILT
jgi:hypothetical protein